jgi:hypothetical protein
MADAAWLATPAAMARYLTSQRCTGCVNGSTDPHEHRCWQWPHHLDVLSLYLAEVAAGTIPRLLVHAPPRHGKSELISRRFPLWFLEWQQHQRVILCSYQAKIASRWGRRVRNDIVEFEDDLTVRIAQDSSAADDWSTTEGGGMKTAGVGGPITGEGANVLIVDDPYKNWEQAASQVYRDTLWDWWVTTAMTRLEPKAGVVLDMTKWHSDDLSSRIIENEEDEEDWVVLSMPAIAEENDQLGRKVGEPLWKERYDVPDLQKIMGRSHYTWHSLYQQRPPDLTGKRVYGEYTGRNLDEIELTDELPLDLSIDFNIDPGMHGVLGQHDTDLDLLTARHVIHERDMNVRQMIDAMAKLIRTRYRKFRWPTLRVFGDASGRGRWEGTGESAWQIVKQKLEEHKIPHRFLLRANNPPVADRVEAMNAALCDVLGKVHYLIHPDCVPLIEDFTKLKWENGEIGKKDRKRSHPSDAEGYRIHRVRPIYKLRQTIGKVGSADGTGLAAVGAHVKTTLYRR